MSLREMLSDYWHAFQQEPALGANADKGVFHFQMMEDFQTGVEIAERLLLEFD